jgi:hypothetical protein
MPPREGSGQERTPGASAALLTRNYLSFALLSLTQCEQFCVCA